MLPKKKVEREGRGRESRRIYRRFSHSLLSLSASSPPQTPPMATRHGHVSPSRLGDAGAAGVREAGARAHAGAGDDDDGGGSRPPTLTWDELLQYR